VKLKKFQQKIMFLHNSSSKNSLKKLLLSQLTVITILTCLFATVFYTISFSAQAITSEQTENKQNLDNIFTQSVEFSDNTNLEDAWNLLLKNVDLKSQTTTVQITSNFQLSDLTLPITFTGNSIEDATASYNLVKSNTINSIVQAKSNESIFLSQKAPINDKEFQGLSDQAIILDNFNTQEIDKTNAKSKDIFVAKAIITSTTETKAIEILSKETKVEIESKEPIKNKIGIKKSDKNRVPKKSSKYTEYKKKIDSLNKKLESETSKINKNNTKNQIPANDTDISNLELPPTLQESLDKTEKNLTPNQENTFEIKDLTKKSTNQDAKKVTRITRIKSINPNYISPEKQKQDQKAIDDEKQNALEHNKKFTQTYTDSEKESSPKEQKQNNPLAFLLNGVQVEANGLSNPSTELLIYSRTNTGLTIDLPYGNTSNGNQFTLYYRHGGWSQRFTFNNDTNEIKMAGKCLDVNGANFSIYTKVQIWDCNGTIAQKWIVNSDFSIRPKYTFERGLNYCLDSKNGITNSSPIHLWSCLGIADQNWRIGDNDFGGNYQIKVNASAGASSGSMPGLGHRLYKYV
jgi:hypothetical protein